MEDTQGQIAPFILKLETMLHDHQGLEWGRNDSIVIKDIGNFTQNILPVYFRHNQLSSFIRQLNKHGFKRLKTSDDTTCEFSHSLFKKDRRDLWEKIGHHKDSDSTDKVLQKIEYLKEANDYSQKHIQQVEKRLSQLEQTLHQFHQKMTIQQQTIEKLQLMKQGGIYNRDGFEQNYDQNQYQEQFQQQQQSNQFNRDNANFPMRPSPIPSLMTGSLSPSQGTSSRYEDTPDQEYLQQFQKSWPAVLLMISNDFDRFLLLGLLKQLNCSYTETYDGAHLLNILQKSSDYQMVLIDSNLQIAQYLVHQIRQKSQIPITCIVDGADSEYAKQVVQYGNTELLVKPPTVNSLSKILKRFSRV